MLRDKFASLAGPRAGMVALVAVALTVALFGALRDVAAAPSAETGALITVNDLQAMIYVWASGTPAVQQVANQTCAQQGLRADACAQVSASVRLAWTQMMQRDPAALGRIGARPQLGPRHDVLLQLATSLRGITHNNVAPFLSATRRDFTAITQPGFIRQAMGVRGRPIPLGSVEVWATAFLQTDLPPGLNSQTSPYVALPDVYLKFANQGDAADIPAIYQPYYLPGGGTAHFTVNLALPGGSHPVKQVPITDVGPWNEDDNWWDPNGTNASLPSSCPVAATLVAADATSNPLVNGICPNGHNQRRTYYYLLYQHNGLPFFQTSGYAPSGTFSDGTSWPLKLPQNCSESAAASVNDDGMRFCANGLANYNNNTSAWMRGNLTDMPVLNQSGIDLAPAVDAALGWTYPSSGLVLVNVGGLP